MPTFADNEAGSSVRSKINAVITQVDNWLAMKVYRAYLD